MELKHELEDYSINGNGIVYKSGIFETGHDFRRET
jgi:hypothetical protein